MDVRFFRFLLVTFSLAFAQLARGQMLETLYSFQGTDGKNPERGLTLGRDGYLYGSTSGRSEGDSINSGTLFKMTTGGVMIINSPVSSMGGIGQQMVQGSDNEFYGTYVDLFTTSGGEVGVYGGVFKMTTNLVLTTLAVFDQTNGAFPLTGITLGSDGNFYGATMGGGTHDKGTIFKMTREGVLTSLVSFDARPLSPLVQGADGDFYGTSGYLTHLLDGIASVYKISTNGAFTQVRGFSGRHIIDINGLAQGSDGNFYGTSIRGGSTGSGTVFKMTPRGAMRRLASFNGKNGNFPKTGLLQARDGNFYGVTPGATSGTVFKVTRSGVLTTLIRFDGTNGANPYGELIQGNDGHLYGTTLEGGPNNSGTVFKIQYPPLFAGRYEGSIQQDSGLEQNHIGTFAVKVTSKMKFSGKMYLDGLKYSVIGQFPTNSFSTHKVIVRRQQPSLSVDFQLVATNGNFQMVGAVSNDFWSATLLCDLLP